LGLLSKISKHLSLQATTQRRPCAVHGPRGDANGFVSPNSSFLLACVASSAQAATPSLRQGIDGALLCLPCHIQKNDKDVEKMRDFVSFWGQIITAVNPFPRIDENAPLMGEHHCRRPSNGALQYTKELAELLNWVEQHMSCQQTLS
jgi:hypothetical protein